MVLMEGEDRLADRAMEDLRVTRQATAVTLEGKAQMVECHRLALSWKYKNTQAVTAKNM